MPQAGFLVTEARDDLDQTLTLLNAITVEYQLRTQWSVPWLAAGAEKFHLYFVLRQLTFADAICLCSQTFLAAWYTLIPYEPASKFPL